MNALQITTSHKDAFDQIVTTLRTALLYSHLDAPIGEPNHTMTLVTNESMDWLERAIEPILASPNRTTKILCQDATPQDVTDIIPDWTRTVERQLFQAHTNRQAEIDRDRRNAAEKHLKEAIALFVRIFSVQPQTATLTDEMLDEHFIIMVTHPPLHLRFNHIYTPQSFQVALTCPFCGEIGYSPRCTTLHEIATQYYAESPTILAHYCQRAASRTQTSGEALLDALADYISDQLQE